MFPPQNLGHLRNALTCPLSYELFQDPVTEEEGTCGHTFEAEWIQEWLSENKTCPLSQNPLRLYQLVGNEPVRDACVILDPNRVTPLNREELDKVNAAIRDVRNRIPAPEGIHRLVKRRVQQQIEKSKEISPISCCLL